MNRKFRDTLLNVATALVILNTISVLSVIVYILAWEILCITWIVSAALVVLFLVVLSIGDKTIYEENSAYYKNYSILHKFYAQVFTYIGLWKRTCPRKYPQIKDGIVQPNGIKNHNDTTDNHTFHTNNCNIRVQDESTKSELNQGKQRLDAVNNGNFFVIGGADDGNRYALG